MYFIRPNIYAYRNTNELYFPTRRDGVRDNHDNNTDNYQSGLSQSQSWSEDKFNKYGHGQKYPSVTKQWFGLASEDDEEGNKENTDTRTKHGHENTDNRQEREDEERRAMLVSVG